MKKYKSESTKRVRSTKSTVRNNIRKEQGITLVALIITIIVLIILAAVTIISINNMQLIPLAINGTQNYAVAQENEGKLVNDITDLVLGAIDNIENGEYFQKAGTVNGKPGTSKNPTIPKGFRPISTEGAVWKKTGEQTDYDKGLVIEDTEGNQFVWVPCYVKDAAGADTTVTEYKQHEYKGTAEKKEDSGVTVDEGEGNWKTDNYTMYGNNWKDDASTYGVTSVKKYGGFWIGRYEAGIPENASFYSKREDGATYEYSSNKKNVTEEGEVKLNPVSKKGYFSWNFVSQQKAVELSKQMYEGNESIESKLIDSYAWDTVTEWIANTDAKDAGEGKTVTDSYQIGNYLNNGSNYNGIYAEHLWTYPDAEKEGGTGWIYASKITKGNITLNWKNISDFEKVTKGRYDQTKITNNTYPNTNKFATRIEIPTGNYEGSKLRNIYDLAGNMFEWTTEVGDHDNTEPTPAEITR